MDWMTEHLKIAWRRISKRDSLEKFIALIAIALSVFQIVNQILPDFYQILSNLFSWRVGMGDFAFGSNAGQTTSSSVPFAHSIFPLIIMMAVVLALFISFAIAATSKNEKTADRAWDIIKIICGFFIGTMTGNIF